MPRFSADPSEVAFLQRRQQHAFLQLLIHSPVLGQKRRRPRSAPLLHGYLLATSDEIAPGAMLDGPPEELKRPSESEQEPCNGKKPRTEDPLVAADVLACFAGPGSEDEHDSSNTTDAAPSSEKKQPAKQDEAPEGSVHNDDDDTD